jgi:membrane protease YdiL (CAAX protease family)
VVARAGIAVHVMVVRKINNSHTAEESLTSSAPQLTIKCAAIIILAALGIGRLSVFVAEAFIQGSISIWPTIFDGLTILDPLGIADGERSLQQAFWLKEVLYSILAIGICIFLKDSISFRPVLNLKFFKNVATTAISAIAIAVVVRTIAGALDPATQTSELIGMATFPIMSTSFILRMCILAPIEEEFIYRGLIWDYTGQVKGWHLAAISIMPWALEHITTGGIWQVTIALITGLVYFWIRQRTGHFGYAALAHSINNAIQIWPSSLF